MVHDWNLYQYIDGECIPPSRDPFWLNANEKVSCPHSIRQPCAAPLSTTIRLPLPSA